MKDMETDNQKKTEFYAKLWVSDFIKKTIDGEEIPDYGKDMNSQVFQAGLLMNDPIYRSVAETIMMKYLDLFNSREKRNFSYEPISKAAANLGLYHHLDKLFQTWAFG